MPQVSNTKLQFESIIGRCPHHGRQQTSVIYQYMQRQIARKLFRRKSANFCQITKIKSPKLGTTASIENALNYGISAIDVTVRDDDMVTTPRQLQRGFQSNATSTTSYYHATSRR